jgi:ParB-like chromosome segregation protein Spo0J
MKQYERFTPADTMDHANDPPTMVEAMSLVLHSIRDLVCDLSTDEKIEAINQIKLALHELSPLSKEPVDCVIWVKGESVVANDYNPNAVAPPEMELLHTSILQDGYTQPIVTWSKEDKYEVVDGFHRNRVGKERDDVRERIHGYLPITVVNTERTDLGDRMVSTIRHNRARGKHNVDSMSDIVVELKRRNWSEEKISKSLGMQVDEILRLCQISGLTEMFADVDFSMAWEIGDDDANDTETNTQSLDELFVDEVADGSARDEEDIDG